MDKSEARKFYWGTATSAHQVEGGNKNDWTEWEKENAKRLAHEASKKQIPDYILKNYPSPLVEENYISGTSCDHYNRYKEDLDIAKSLGLTAYRFSIEWSRVESEEGKFDDDEIEHYRAVIRACHARGIEPFVTLWHWTIPLWLRNRGGWANAVSVELFLRYAERMARALPEIKFWITLNETNVYTGLCYWRGVWPPESHSVARYLRTNHHLSQAHCRAYRTIKKINPDAQIGIAHNFIYFSRSRLKSFFWNHFFLRSIRGHQDFVGVNYYYSDRQTKHTSEFLDWPIDPEGFYKVLKEAARYHKPIFITENGIADARDIMRAEFIKSHITWMRRAIDRGVDVRGYFYWSLLDNFEWDKGFWPRFGLVEIDYKTMERRIRQSAHTYASLIKEQTEK